MKTRSVKFQKVRGLCEGVRVGVVATPFAVAVPEVRRADDLVRLPPHRRVRPLRVPPPADLAVVHPELATGLAAYFWAAGQTELAC